MNYKIMLKQKGARIIKEVTYHACRPKVDGYMWKGSAILDISGILFHFGMWHHGGDRLTKDEAEKYLRLEGITKNGKFYDAYWHSKITGAQLWLHHKGWFGFGDRDFKKQIEDLGKAPTTSMLTKLGFEKILG